jgi:SAM-dependent methyltransferase
MSSLEHTASARDAYDVAADVYDDFTAHHDHEGWTALIERLARAHGLAGDRLLDVGCGTGNSFLPFLERGYRVTACDVSPRMLARARDKCRGRARLTVADLRSLPRLGSFDLVLAIDDVLNYLTAAELPAAFRGLAANLAVEGVLVFDVNTELTYRTFFASHDRQGHTGLTWDGHVDAERFRPGDAASATLNGVSRHVQHHHPPRVVQRALGAAGLRAVAVHGMDLDGALGTPVDETVHTKALFVVTCEGTS